MKGYVALTCVLVMLPLLLLTGVNTLFKNISMLAVGKMSYDSQILVANTQTCIEETVNKLKREPTLTGDINIQQSGWNCDVTITNTQGDSTIKLLTITATDEYGSETVFSKTLNTSTNPFELTNVE